jgi:hypothetical protein
VPFEISDRADLVDVPVLFNSLQQNGVVGERVVREKNPESGKPAAGPLAGQELARSESLS